MSATPRLRVRAPARFLTLVGLIAALAAITASSASAWGSQGINFGPTPPGSNGWYTQTPLTGQVSFDVDGSPSSPDSGDYSERLTGITCGGPGVTGGLSGNWFSDVSTSVQVTGETGPGGVAVVCNATYERGTYFNCFGFFGCNFTGYTPYDTAQAGIFVKIDATPPHDVVVHATSSPNANGWYNSPVTFTVSGQDDGSGIQNCGFGFFPWTTPSVTVNTDTFGFGSQAGCRDVAGLGTASGASWRYDSTLPALAPTVTPTGVLVQGSVATAAPHATDTLSGIDAANTGCDPVDTSTVGMHAVTCTATDMAGNTKTAQAGYEVAPAACNGLIATIVGTAGDDVIEGTSADDVIYDVSGNNKIISRGGQDTICTGDGNDTIDSGEGADTVQAGGGDNEIWLRGGNDQVTAGAGNDMINGGAGTDTCTAGGGVNNVTLCEILL